MFVKKVSLVLGTCGIVVASSAAHAQSAVTLYGIIDAGIAYTNNVSKGGTSGSLVQATSGEINGSRFGLRGAEDLGGGLKAIFGLEGALGTDTGAFGSFDRQSIVGLSGGFGTVKLGRHDTSFDDIRDLSISSNLWDSEFSPTKIAYTAGVADYSSRASNQIRYESPSFGGFSVGVSYGLDEDAAVRADTTAFNLRYRAGNLDVGVGYQEQKANNREYTTIGGAYNFGVARLSAGYNHAEISGGAKADGYALGVSVPLGSVEVSVGYAYSKAKAAGVTTAKGSGLAAGVTYALSKRTRLYGALLDGDVENGAGVTTTDRRLYSVGVRHDF
jgi:predicted porin